MADKLADDAAAVAFHITLDGGLNLNDPVAGNRLGDSLVQSPFGYVHQALRFNAAPTDRDCPGVVPNEPIVNHPDVQTNDVAKINPPLTRQPMHDLLVHRDAQVTGKLSIAQKGAARSVMFYPASGVLIDFARGPSRLNEIANLIQHETGDHTGGPHRLEIAFTLEDDHLQTKTDL
jgi:hypothetical protein